LGDFLQHKALLLTTTQSSSEALCDRWLKHGFKIDVAFSMRSQYGFFGTPRGHR